MLEAIKKSLGSIESMSLMISLLALALAGWCAYRIMRMDAPPTEPRVEPPAVPAAANVTVGGAEPVRSAKESAKESAKAHAAPPRRTRKTRVARRAPAASAPAAEAPAAEALAAEAPAAEAPAEAEPVRRNNEAGAREYVPEADMSEGAYGDVYVGSVTEEIVGGAADGSNDSY